MRDNKGKLIAVWVPGYHGAGGSTVANSVGIALQHLTEKRTLLLNMGSTRNFMEQYMKNDVDVRFSMDYLRSFDVNIKAEHIKTYAAAVNDMLYILPNCKLSKEISKVGDGFNQRFLESALEAYDIVVADLEAGINSTNQMYLEKADVVLAVMDENRIRLEELFSNNQAIKSLVDNEKTMVLFNGLHRTGSEIRTLKLLSQRLGLKNSYGMSFDVNAYYAACIEGKFYSFLKNELCKKKADCQLAEEITELCSIIAERLFINSEATQDKATLVNMLFTRAKHWREADA